MRASTTGRVLHDPKGGSFRFDAGAVCLDFVHTGGEGPYAVFESLHAPDDLAAWLAEPPLDVTLTVPMTAAELDTAKALRQAMWVVAHARADGLPLPATDVAVINHAASAPSLAAQLASDGVTAGWAAPVTASQAMSTLAREMIGLLTGPLAGRIRECAGERCPLVFVDSSRPGARRWCSMERCGNRHKLRTHRARPSSDG
ncbi:CGNR zinc finger domain-containing protein [Actinomadura harenae]|uniref:Zf-CGNR multi-domain protein n=1 Tax=Actinomadura harenae TaxID=2483351 RepID=A0A3M2M081_9ACTN|nr:ABATE domain-containing protein [Actinomadura harenae]RMI42896.1 zf-CGNR multi-domain protein [Actinomadura harenae]